MQPVARDHHGCGAELGGWIDVGTRPSHRSGVVAVPRWVVSRGEGALTVGVCRSAAHSSFNYDLTDSSTAAAAWVVARR